MKNKYNSKMVRVRRTNERQKQKKTCGTRLPSEITSVLLILFLSFCFSCYYYTYTKLYMYISVVLKSISCSINFFGCRQSDFILWNIQPCICLWSPVFIPKIIQFLSRLKQCFLFKKKLCTHLFVYLHDKYRRSSLKPI